MFEALQQALGNAIRVLRGRARLTEANMREGLEMVQQALLEADVSVPVVKQFIARVSQQALGEKVLKSLNPTQQLVGIVYQELVNLMGPVDHTIRFRPEGGVVLLCGLQGSGKTTTCAKLARYLSQRRAKPLLVAGDLQRPAAIDQLELLGQKAGIPVFVDRQARDPLAVCKQALEYARRNDLSPLIVDTAGRLHVDQELMDQLTYLDRSLEPDEVLFVVDAMTGQDAVNSAKAFNEALAIDGVILTKLDGDARGGAALSVKAVTGVPIKFIGTGEGIDALEEFHPDRMARRILGLGDILTLVEQAQQKFDQEQLLRQQEALKKGEFTLQHFRDMLDQTRRLGSLTRWMSLLPGMSQITEMIGDEDADDQLRRVRGIIDSMTPEERQNPRIIDASRRRRIAAGAGVDQQEVSLLLKQFEGLADIMRRLSQMGMRGRLQAIQQLSQALATNPTLTLKKQKAGTGKRLTPEEKARLRKQRERELRRRRREQKRRQGNQ
jgi:signal recognition particle subunit SRP54